MRTRFNSSQRSVLFALGEGSLRHGEHGWLAEGDSGAQLLPDGIVRWLFGEGFLGRVPTTTAAYRLNDRGLSALREARAEEEMHEMPFESDLRGAPLLLLSPAPHSEELDYLLAVPLTPGHVDSHRSRLGQLARFLAGDPDRFEFVQFRDEVFALPIMPRLAELELLPGQSEALLFLPGGLPDGLDTHHCPDRGVNYGSGWLQWFGGFDSESPVIVSERVATKEFERSIAAAS